jgi:BlaI family transcriptional regulator, penicillinase repressor
MTPRRSQKESDLTDGELRIMQVLWNAGPSTVLDIQKQLDYSLEESSIRTFLSILERKGKVVREKRSRAFVYAASADRTVTRQRAVRQLIRKFFSDPVDLVLSVANDEDLSKQELEKLRDALNRAIRRNQK